MAYNIVHYDESSNSIQKFSSSDLTNLAEAVLEYMAAGTYTGSITIGTDNPIGTFTDTVLQGGVGTADITVLSNTYTLSQINTATLTTETDPPKYVGLEVGVGVTTLQENSTTLENLADEIIAHMVSGGSNSYYLGASAPSDGSTWVSLGTLLNTLENFTVTANTYNLWKKTNSGSSTTYKKPLKLVNSELQKFTQTEVERLAKIVEQRIIATNVGTYALQQTVPSTGLWSNAGTITDTRRIVTGASFDGASFDSQYAGLNEDAVAFSSLTTFYGAYSVAYYGPGNYLGPSQVGFIGPAANVPINFAGPGSPIAYYNYLGPAPGYYGPSPTGPDGITFWGPGIYNSAVVVGSLGYGPGLAYYVGTVANSATFAGATTAYNKSYPSSSQGYVDYLGPLDIEYSGLPSYVSTYDSTAIGSETETVSTVTLWKRIG